jgi:lysozyme
MDILALTRSILDVLEDCRLDAYYDRVAGIWTIGRGHTVGVSAGMVIDQEQADAWTDEDLAPLLPLVAKFPPVPAAALLCFGLNCGLGALKRVISGSLVVTPNGFFDRKGIRYGATSAGKYVKSLDRRRRFEAALFLSSTIPFEVKS